MLLRHSQLNKFAWFTLLVFFVGAVIVPVVHNVFHQHGYVGLDAPDDFPALVNHIDDTPAAECIVCNIVPAVPLTDLPALQHRLPLLDLHFSSNAEYPQIQEFNLSARAPPAG